jgi:hypothetical protein
MVGTGAMGYGDAFGWPFKDPGWFGKLLLTGLILLIPIVGVIYVYGWMLAAVDNLRRGVRLLPETTFDHLSRGFNIFVVLLVWGLVVAIPAIIILFAFFAAMVAYVTTANAAQASGLPPPPVPAFTGAVFLPLISLLSLALQIAYPAIIVNTEWGGIAGGLNFAAVWRTFRSRPTQSFIAGLLVVVAGYISGFGVLLCCVGLLVTIPYFYAVEAGLVAVYERDLGAVRPAAPPPPTGLA